MKKVAVIMGNRSEWVPGGHWREGPNELRLRRFTEHMNERVKCATINLTGDLMKADCL